LLDQDDQRVLNQILSRTLVMNGESCMPQQALTKGQQHSCEVMLSLLLLVGRFTRRFSRVVNAAGLGRRHERRLLAVSQRHAGRKSTLACAAA
jgi:hypothetical protein